MNRPDPSRRTFLAGGASIAGVFPFLGSRTSLGTRTGAGLGFLPFLPEEDDRTLVVVQLAGGNDGLNTIVPHGDDLYHSSRSSVRVATEDVLKIDDYRGFNPLWSGFRKLYDEGQLAIVEGVGYPTPNRSHFTSFDIWHAADPRGRSAGDGWLTRLAGALQARAENGEALAVHVGDRMPYSLHSAVHPSICFRNPALYRWNKSAGAIADTAGREGGMASGPLGALRSTFQNAHTSSQAVRDAADSYKPRVEYPEDGLGSALRTAAALIQGHIGARILSVELAGFDTHASQVATHQRLLTSVNGAVAAFLDDLRGTPMGERTTVMLFSEFGRRVKDNGSGGTDHGTAGPMFLAGAGVAGGLYGKHPSLAELDEGDLIFNTDFRSVYASVIEGWFGVPPTDVLHGSFPTLPLFKS